MSFSDKYQLYLLSFLSLNEVSKGLTCMDKCVYVYIKVCIKLTVIRSLLESS